MTNNNQALESQELKKLREWEIRNLKQREYELERAEKLNWLTTEDEKELERIQNILYI